MGPLSASDPTGVVEMRRSLSCPSCGGLQWRLVLAGVSDQRYHTEGRFDLMGCTHCGTIATVPQLSPSDLLSRYGDDYASFGESDASRGPRLIRQIVWFPYHLRWGWNDEVDLMPPGRALDVGCGTGSWLAEVIRRGWNADGLEPNAPAAEEADRRVAGSGTVFNRSMEDVSLPFETYDLVRMSHVLEHLIDPGQAARRVNHWLRMGGLFVLQLPDWSSLERRVFGRSWFGLDVPRHTWHFGPEQLTTLLEHAGYEVICVKPQRQASCLAGSFQTVAMRFLGRKERFRLWRPLYVVTVPIASLLLALGIGGTMKVVARKARRVGS